MLHAQLTALVLAAATFAASGCGGSSNTTSTASTSAEQTPTTAAQTQPVYTGPRLTRAELIAKADLICARVNAVRASNKITSKQSLAESAAKLSGAEQIALEEMSKLTPPVSLESTWNSMITGYKATATDIAKIKQAVSDGDTHEIRPLLTRSTVALHQTITEAKSAGFKDCGRTR
jgi:hypothetical protein